MCKLSFLCRTLAAERQLKRIREHYLRAVLYQEIGWYDTTRPSELSSRIAKYVGLYVGLLLVCIEVLTKFSDTLLMQDAMGEKVGALVMHNCTFLAGIVVGFAYGWQLTLVVSLFVIIE